MKLTTEQRGSISNIIRKMRPLIGAARFPHEVCDAIEDAIGPCPDCAAKDALRKLAEEVAADKAMEISGLNDYIKKQDAEREERGKINGG